MNPWERSGSPVSLPVSGNMSLDIGDGYDLEMDDHSERLTMPMQTYKGRKGNHYAVKRFVPLKNATEVCAFTVPYHQPLLRIPMAMVDVCMLIGNLNHGWLSPSRGNIRLCCSPFTWARAMHRGWLGEGLRPGWQGDCHLSNATRDFPMDACLVIIQGLSEIVRQG